MEKEEFLKMFLSHIAFLTENEPEKDDCRVIEWIDASITTIKELGLTVGFAFEPREIHLVGKTESSISIADYGTSYVKVIGKTIIKGDMGVICSHENEKINTIKCVPLPSDMNYSLKTDNSEDYNNPFWVLSPLNFEHTPFVGITQHAFCVGFITDKL